MSGAGGFFDLPPELSSLDDASVVILPVPYDATSSWIKGADRGPAALLAASQQVEVWDIETGTEPCRHGIASEPPLEFGGSPEDLAAEVARRVRRVLDRQQLPVLLGGEHSVSIGAIQACVAHQPGISVLQLDAHADTRESYSGTPYSHACVMARTRELCPIAQVGIRSLDTSEMERLDASRVVWAHEIARDSGSEWIDRALALLTDTVYVTIDLDVFDPALVPATGTPEPGGLSWYQVTDLLARVAREKQVVAFDIVELLPGHPPSAFTAAKLLYRFLAEILNARGAA